MRLFIAALILFLFISTTSFAQQNDTEIIRVETSLVVVSTKVTDRNNKSITDLKKEDFRLFENGVEQEIIGFDDAFAPFTIALVLDVSDSTRFKLEDIKAAAIEFLRELQPADRVMIFSFDKTLNKIAEGSVANLNTLQNSIIFTRTGGGTSLYDTLETLVNEHFKKISGKKAIVIFTDGVDTLSSRATYSSSIKLAQEAGILTFPIQYSTLPDVEQSFGGNVRLVTTKGEDLSVAYKRGTQYLSLLANETGGDFYYADTLENLSKTFTKIAKQLSQIYNLSYYPEDQAKSGNKRKIKVEVKRERVVVQTRKVFVLK